MFKKTYQALEVKATAEGIVEGIVSVTENVDLGNDIVKAGAFAGFLSQVKSGDLPMPPVIWQHDPSRPENILGNILEMEELMPGDSRLPDKLLRAGYGGLYVKVKYDFGTPNGETVYNHVKSGRIVQWSFAFDAPDRSFDEKGHRLLKTITPVYEVSNVLVGMNPATSVMSVKGLEPSPERKEATEVRLQMAEYIAEEFIQKAVEAMAEVPEIETKDMNGNVDVPVLEGDEAVHTEALQAALNAIKALIAQEVMEDECEFGCIATLASIAQQLSYWAVGEASEYGDSPYAAMSADELEVKESPAAEAAVVKPGTPDWMLAGFSIAAARS